GVLEGDLLPGLLHHGRAAGRRALAFVARAAGQAEGSEAVRATPLVSMVSYSIIHRVGVERYLNDAATAGLDGLIVPDLPVEDVPDLLDGLVGKSIVVCDQSEVPRFRMLGAIRHYGRRRLDETEAEELADRHLAYYERLVVDTAATWFGADQLAHANRLRSALPDLRVALDRILSGPEPDRGVVMVTGLSTLWVCLSRLQEGEIWLKRALGAVTDPPARAHFVLGWIQLSTGHRAAARASLARAVELAADSAEADVADQADVLLAVSEAFAGHFDAAVSGGQAALTRRRADGDDASVAVILMLLGEIYCGAARADDARRCAEESERISAAAGELWCRSYALWVRALVLCLRENYADAADVARESLRMKIALQDVAGILLVSEVLCWSMAADGRWADAAQLYAAIQPRGSSFPTSLRDFGYLDDQRAVWGARIVEGLGADKYHEIARSAVTLDTAAIGQLALGAGSAAPTPAAGDPSHGLLTKRESEVAELAAAGLTSRAIATRLFISTRTAEVHVERIMVKLGFTRRAQIAAWWHAESGTASRT
ncbi:MAG: tryptophan synthase subunit alpha, partial [Actinobacteria bacterium]|nr:tryptophan synthase subunit alpha [Actinomycetota bacterium]